jgi:hypothetical protein
VTKYMLKKMPCSRLEASVTTAARQACQVMSHGSYCREHASGSLALTEVEQQMLE